METKIKDAAAETAAAAPSLVERAFVAGCMDDQHGPKFHAVAKRYGLTVSAFSDHASAAILRAVLHCAGQGGVSLALVHTALAETGDLEKIGGMLVFESIADLFDPYHADALAEQIVAADRQRRARATAETYLQGGSDLIATAAALTRLAEPATAPDMLPIDAADLARVAPAQPDAIMEGLFDTGDKIPVIGSSKSRKSFFVLMLALSVAAGRDRFLSWRIPTRRKVLLIQYEIKAAHFQGRIYRLCQAMGITPDDLQGWLSIVNARGLPSATKPDGILALAKSTGAALVILDPLYKLLEGDENAAQDMKPLLSAFDRVAESSGAALMYVHHNAKGFAGDRDQRDRGAGSGVLARDFDAAIYITDHADDDNLLVLSTLARNYPPGDSCSITWVDSRFEVTADAPNERTSRNKRTTPDRCDINSLLPAAVAIVHNGALMMPEYRAQLLKPASTHSRMQSLLRLVLSTGQLEELRDWKRGQHDTWIGTKAQIADLRQRKLKV